MGLRGSRSKMMAFKKILLLIIVIYAIFWTLISFFSVQSAIYLYRKEGEVFVEVKSLYKRIGVSAICREKDKPYSLRNLFLGYAYGNNDEVYGRHVFNRTQLMRISGAEEIKENTRLVCFLKQIDFDIFIPSSNKFEITVK
jgi:hypothetical protein